MNRKEKLVKKVLRDAKMSPQKLARRQKRREARLERQRIRQEGIAKYRDVRLPGVARPQNPGDTCHKCGDAVIYKDTKRKPGPRQSYAYRGHLHCPTCGTNYHCEQYRYDIPRK